MFYLLKVLAHKNKPPTHQLYDEVTKSCRVGLTDIDFNMHLNNAKYFKYMDLARLEHLLATGMLWKMIAARINPVIAHNEISYIRELRTWQRFTVSARVVGADDKYLYYEQRFMSEGKLCTHSFMRIACLHQGKSRPMAEVFAVLGITSPPPALPEPVLLWKEMLDAKKKYAFKRIDENNHEEMRNHV